MKSLDKFGEVIIQRGRSKLTKKEHTQGIGDAGWCIKSRIPAGAGSCAVIFRVYRASMSESFGAEAGGLQESGLEKRFSSGVFGTKLRMLLREQRNSSKAKSTVFSFFFFYSLLCFCLNLHASSRRVIQTLFNLSSCSVLLPGNAFTTRL